MSVNFTFREGFEAFVVQPLSEGSVLTSVLDNFLSNNTTPEGSKRSDLSSSKESNISDGVFFDFFNLEDAFFVNILSLGVDFLNDRE